MDTIISILTNKWVILNNILSIILLEWSFSKLKPLAPKNDADRERDKKYPSFKRNDLNKISRPVLYLLAPTVFLRVLIGYCAMAACSITIFSLSLTHKRGDPYTGWKLKVISFSCSVAARIVIMMMSCLWIETKQVQLDYSKWLGPDWKRSFEKPGSVISNHQCWVDIMVHQYRQPPCHVSKASVKKVPFIGHIADACGCLFLERENSDQKKTMVQQIQDRQTQCEKGLFPPLIIYPEGGTTNGTTLVKFKKGAFNGLKSIMPILINYYSPFLDIENSVIHFVSHTVMCATNPSTKVTIKELPVFQPNEYFFKNYQKQDEEKWQTYARVLREIMAEESGLQISDQTIEDKFEYKKLLYPVFKGKYSD